MRQTKTPIGALWALLASLTFSVNDMLIKFLSDGYALHQIVFTRSLTGVLLLAIVIIPLTGGYGALRTRRPGLHLIRALFVVAHASALGSKSANQALSEQRRDALRDVVRVEVLARHLGLFLEGLGVIGDRAESAAAWDDQVLEHGRGLLAVRGDRRRVRLGLGLRRHRLVLSVVVVVRPVVRLVVVRPLSVRPVVRPVVRRRRPSSSSVVVRRRRPSSSV